MNHALYPKLAFDGIRKNRRMYLPYILTCVGMVMMHYIISSMRYNKNIIYIRGATDITYMLSLGTGVVAVFACIFLFYTNSFLMRRRKKEFGLFYVLGMGKKNLSRIMIWEAIAVWGISLVAGLLSGIIFSKIAELGLVKILGGEAKYDFYVSAEAMTQSIITFTVIFLLILIRSLIQIGASSAISLVKSENVGEKPPKANAFLGIVGFLILGAAYYVAVSVKEPLAALSVFFAAVIAVIIATYLIMICGSVFLCKLLQKNKKYYYKPNHFVSVSHMTYRMKRNGAGLASVCILATMVLVMISSTSALLIGSEESLRTRYPREINTSKRFEFIEHLSDENIAALRGDILTVAEKHGAVPENVIDYRYASISGVLSDSTLIFDTASYEDFGIDTISKVHQIYIVPLDDYNSMSGTDKTLEDGEALIFAFRTKYDKDIFGFYNAKQYKIKEHLSECFISGNLAAGIAPTLALVVPNIEDAIDGLATKDGDRLVRFAWEYNFDTSLDEEREEEMFRDILRIYADGNEPSGNFEMSSIESRESNRMDFYTTYGGLLYLGIILSIVFIFAAVLIIYYKQVSEGYEDRKGFEIMQKVGITQREIRKSVNSQLLVVFFMPLLTAGLHLAFAFPIIEKLLRLFNLFNSALYATTTVSCFLVFALLYAVVYRITSNAYYNIVSGFKDTK